MPRQRLTTDRLSILHLSRRPVLAWCALAWVGLSRPFAWGSGQSDQGGAEGGSQSDAGPALSALFLTVSQDITARKQLDPDLVKRYLHGFQQRHADFASRLQALATHPADTAVQPLKAEIAMAWYVGQIGLGDPPKRSGSRQAKEDPEGQPQPIVVAYEGALMFDAVGDVLAIPSFCRDVPGYWAEAPRPADGPRQRMWAA